MKEYKLAKGWAIIIWIFAPLLIILFSLGLLTPFLPATGEQVSLGLYLAIIMPLSLSMITLMTIGLLDTVKNKVIISSDTLIFKSTFINRDLKFWEISGFRISDQYIIVEPVSKERKRIKISTYLGKCDEIISWLSSNFPDLDKIRFEKEQTEILGNSAFGISEEQRQEKLKQARLTAKMLNRAGIASIVWTMFYPVPYNYAIIFSMCIPVLAIFALFRFNGLIRIDEGKGKAYPTVSPALFFSSCGLCLRALFDYNIFSLTNAWKPSLLLLIVLMSLIIWGTKEFNFKKAKDCVLALSIALFLFAYSYGSVIIINCYYDRSIPETYKATILSKRVNSGKTTSYYFELTPWGSRTETDEVSISKTLYKKLDKGSDVNIYFKRGLFSIPWFVVGE